MSAVAEIRDMAKKKTDEEPKRYGSLIRVSDEFAEALRQATRFGGLSTTAYADAYLLPVIRKQYRDAVLRTARGMEGGKS